jgi:hypothetical protein
MIMKWRMGDLLIRADSLTATWGTVKALFD